MRHLRFWLPVVILALLGLLPGACSSNPKPAKIDPERQLALYTETAQYHFANEDFARAESQALKALALDPENIKMRIMVAFVRQKRDTRDDLLSAATLFRQVLLDLEGEDDQQLAKNLPTVQFGLAAVLERLGVLATETAAALEKGERVVEAASGADSLAQLRERAAGYFAESRLHYAALLETHPQDLNALNGMQRVLALEGDSQGSLKYTDELLRVSGVELDFFRKQLERKDITADEEQRFQSLSASATDLQINTHLFASSALAGLGRGAEALAHLDAVVGLVRDLPEAYSRRAQLREKLGLFEGAIADIDQFLRLSPHPFSHPDVRSAYDLRTRCERALMK